MKYDLDKHNNLINDWFYNVSKNIVNDEILFLKEDQEHLVPTIKNELKRNNFECRVIDIFQYIIDYDSLKNINCILYKIDNTKPIHYQSFLEKKLLLVQDNIVSYINAVKNNQQAIQNEERFLYYVEKVNPLNIIKGSNIKIESFVNFSVNITFLMQNIYDGFNLLLNKTSYKKESFDHSLQSDIGNLKEYSILTARLAVIIYRIANLNLHASVTEVGRYFHKQLGSKSKTYNYKLMIKSNNTASLLLDDTLKGKNFKVYDLTVNGFEIAIRIEIAKKLLALKEIKLDAITVSKVTMIDIEEVEKIIKN